MHKTTTEQPMTIINQIQTKEETSMNLTQAIEVMKSNQNNKEEMAMVNIISKRQVEVLRRKITDKGAGITSTLLRVGKKVTPGVIAVPGGRETREFELRRELVMTSRKTARLFDNFTDEIITVDFENVKSIDTWGYTLAAIGTGLDRKFYLFREEEGTMYDILSDEIVGMSLISNADGSMKEGVVLYSGKEGGQLSSPSQSRKSNITFKRINGRKNVQDALNELTYGAFEIMDGKEMNLSGIVKGAARLSQYKAPQCLELAEVGTMAVFMGKFKNEAGNDYKDGSADIAADFLAQAFNKALEGYNFTTRSVLGIGVQIRPWMSKVMAISKERAYIDEFVKTQGFESVVIDRNNVSKEEQENFNLAFEGKGDYKGKLVVVTDKPLSWKIDVMSDLNGIKAPWNLTKSSGLNLLDMTKGNHGNEANTSKQMLQTLIHADKDMGKNWISEQGKKHVEDAFNRTFTKGATPPSMKEMARPNLSTLAPKIAPTFAIEKHKRLFRSISKNFLKGVLRDTNKLSFRVDGGNYQIIPDFGMDFGVELLDKGEVFLSEAFEYFTENETAKENMKVTLIKYPKICVTEFAQERVVGLEEMIEKIEASNMTERQKKVVKKAYQTIHSGIIVVPAIELYKNLLAGMDFDFDGLSAIFDKEFNSIVSLVKPIAVKIMDEAIKLEDKQIFGATSGWTAFRNLVASANKSIGEITIMNDVIVALMNNPEAAKEVLSAAFGGDHTVEAYNPLTITKGEKDMALVEIDAYLTESIVGQIKACKLTEDNTRRMLFDLDIVFRRLQEKTIDSAKTNEHVEVPVDINEFATLQSQQDINVEFDWDADVDVKNFKAEGGMLHGGVFYSINKDASGWKEVGSRKDGTPIEKYVLSDVFQEVKIDVAREIMKKALKLRAKKQELSPDEMAVYQEWDKKEGSASIVKALIQVKVMYNDITGIWMSDMEEAKTEEERDVLNDKYKADITCLGNVARRVTKDLSMVDRATAAQWVAKDSSFAFSVLPVEFLAMVNERYSEINWAGEKLFISKNVNEGDILNFVSGQASGKDGVLAVTTEELNGSFEIKSHDGKLYASKPVADFINEPEVNESEVMFRVKPSRNFCEDTLKKLKPGAKITLTANPKDGDSIFADGEFVAKLDCPDSGGAFTKLYNKADGTLKTLSIGKINTRDGELTTLVATLDKFTAGSFDAEEYGVVDFDKAIDSQEVDFDDLF